MLAYAAYRPVVVDRRPHPNALLMIIGTHVAALAVVMSAKMDIPIIHRDPPPKISWVPQPKTPPPIPAKTAASPTPIDKWIDRSDTNRKSLPLPNAGVDLGSKLGPMPFGDTGKIEIPEFPPINFTPVKSGPRLLTPASELKPPYPASKLDNGEEAVLTLKLTIDANGRVTAVDPVGRTDPVFLDAARRYVMAHWRYKPASDDGRAVASSAVVTLHFELNG